MNSNVVWGVLLGVCAVYEAYAIGSHRVGDTLSERLRSWFRVSTRSGRIVFTVTWLAFTAWFVPHIIVGG